MEDDRLRQELADLFARLRGTVLEGQCILAGSSGLLAIAPDIPSLTEDIDLLVSIELVQLRGDEIVDTLASCGYSHVAGTPTFVSATGGVFDLIGYSETETADHVAGGERLKVMVFGDLSVIMGSPSAVVLTTDGIPALSPAAFCASKLLTLRLHKGAKDKLQAILALDTHAGDAAHLDAFVELMKRFPAHRLEDVLLDAQAAVLAISHDVSVNGREVAGYAPFREALERGLHVLSELEQRYLGPT